MTALAASGIKGEKLVSFIQREIDRLSAALAKTPQDHEGSQPLYAAKQALSWALEPEVFASPSAMLHRLIGVGAGGTEGTGIIDGGAVLQPQQPPTAN